MIVREIDLVVQTRIHEISRKLRLEPDERTFLQNEFRKMSNWTYELLLL